MLVSSSCVKRRYSNKYILARPNAVSASLAISSSTGRISSRFWRGFLNSINISSVVPFGDVYSTVNPLEFKLLNVADVASSFLPKYRTYARFVAGKEAVNTRYYRQEISRSLTGMYAHVRWNGRAVRSNGVRLWHDELVCCIKEGKRYRPQQLCTAAELNMILIVIISSPFISSSSSSFFACSLLLLL